jgi:hypothetical protein
MNYPKSDKSTYPRRFLVLRWERYFGLLHAQKGYNAATQAGRAQYSAGD